MRADSTSNLPCGLYSAEQSRDMDRALIAAGIPGIVLMERAAESLWQVLREYWPQTDDITVLCGGGNNAGDGYLMAILAAQSGCRVQVLYLSDPLRLQDDAALAWQRAVNQGLSIQPWLPQYELRGVLVDALLGTGLVGAARTSFVDLINHINASGLPVLAVDIPSGVQADTGAVEGVAVRADVTVTFITLKLGLFTGDGPDYVGSLRYAPLHNGLGTEAAVETEARRLCDGCLPCLSPRRLGAHKGCFGHVLTVGGERGTAGAALLAAEASLITGAGLVSVATRGEHQSFMLARRPELMVAEVPSPARLLPMLERVDTVVVGPGLGTGPWGQALLGAVRLQENTRQVWDADALNLAAQGQILPPVGTVLTPHPGEAARLLDCSTLQVQRDRPDAVRQLAQKYQSVVVLKGVGTLIGSPCGRLALCDRGHPAMASSGLGDVLSGVIGALLAQGLEAFEAACLGVWLHARAGERLGSCGRGLLAGDMAPQIRALLEQHSPCLG